MRDDDHELAHRKPPHNIEAEQALLGAILINNDALHRVNDTLKARHFFVELHQKIYAAIGTLVARGQTATPITLQTYFESAEPIDPGLTVPQYLVRLGAQAPTISNVVEYARVVRNLDVRRGLILIGEDIANAAYDSPVDFPPEEQIEEAEARLFALAEYGRDASREVGAAEIQARTVAVIEAAHKNKGKPTGLSTGIKDLDVKLGRLQPSRLIVIAGRPSMGKTSLATNIIRAQAAPVHFFSLEMSDEEIGFRLLSEEVGIPGDELRRGELGEAQWRQVLAAQEKLGRQPLTVDPMGGLTIGQIATRARRTKRKHGTALIVVDYLQLAHGTKRSENRTQEVSDITLGLKTMAKELEVPVIALSQLSRDVEKREDKRPQLADLRESGSIEQDADQVIFLYREEYYLERKKPAEGDPQALARWIQKLEQAKGRAEAIVAKNRHGPQGTVALHFNASLTRFSDLAYSGQGSGAMNERDAA